MSSGDETTVLSVLSPIIIIIGHSQMTKVNIVFHGQLLRYYFLRLKIKLKCNRVCAVGKQVELTKKSLEYLGQMGHESTNQ